MYINTYDVNLIIFKPILIEKYNRSFPEYIKIIDTDNGCAKKSMTLEEYTKKVSKTTSTGLAYSSNLIQKVETRDLDKTTLKSNIGLRARSHSDRMIYGVSYSFHRYYLGKHAPIDAIIFKNIKQNLQAINQYSIKALPLEYRKFSGDASGVLGEALFPIIMEQAFNVSPDHIIHLRPAKTGHQMPTADFLIIIRNADKQNSHVITQKLLNGCKRDYKYVLAEVKSKFNNLIEAKRVIKALTQLQNTLTSSGLGILFIIDRPGDTTASPQTLPIQVKIMGVQLE